ncbi:MAG: hypothetical protein ABJG15_09915 [Hyphomonadaceae bacterium]
MPRILLIELALLISPFLIFGLYRFFVSEAESEGRKAWPINLLFGIGAALAIAFWLFFVLREDRDRNACFEPDRFDTASGELIKGRKVACESGIDQIGVPRTEDPGGEATGVSGRSADPAPVPSQAEPTP